jgi:ParB/RepB/Spo0J family partition protein
MNTNKEIVMIALEDLIEHPRQEEFYGATRVDEGLAETIKLRGILQPLLVSEIIDDPENNGKYYIVAGHRRKICALSVGLTEAPCVIKKYDNLIEESMFDLLASNKQREKSKEQKTKEINALQQIICQIKKLRGNTSEDEDSEGSETTNSIDSEKKQLSEVQIGILKELEDASLDTAQIVADKLGLTRSEVERVIALCNDDYQQKWINKVSEMGLTPAKQKEAIIEWDRARKAYCDGEVSLNEAYRAVLNFKKDVEKQLKPTSPQPSPKERVKEKKKKEEKERPPFVCPCCSGEVNFEDVYKYVKSLK